MNEETAHEVGQGLLRLSTARTREVRPGKWWVEFPEQVTALGERALFGVFLLADTDTGDTMVCVFMPDSLSQALKDGRGEVVTVETAGGVAQRLVRALLAQAEGAASEVMEGMVGVDIVDVAGGQSWDVADLRESGRGNPLVRLTTWTLRRIVERVGGLLFGLDRGLQAPTLTMLTYTVPVDPMVETEVTEVWLNIGQEPDGGYWWNVSLGSKYSDPGNHTLKVQAEKSLVEAYTKGLDFAQKWDGYVPEA